MALVPLTEDYHLFSAIRFRQNIVSALEGESVRDPRISDWSMMENFKWTYDELLATPFHVIVSIGFIKSSIKARENLKQLKAEGKGKGK